MVKLRLSRFGRKGEPTYRIVATDSHNKRDGRAIEELGYYIPASKKLELKSERVQYWVSVGAQPTETVARMLVKQGLWDEKKLPKTKYNIKPGQKNADRAEAKVAKAEAAKAAAEAPKAEEVVEPVESETTTENTEAAVESTEETNA